MSWKVEVSKKAVKGLKDVPEVVRERLRALVLDIKAHGPIRGNWPNYSKLGNNRHHCHIKKGRPTYVACWEVKEGFVTLVEVYYAGTHEKAPY